jgi:hypothetical protein
MAMISMFVPLISEGGDEARPLHPSASDNRAAAAYQVHDKRDDRQHQQQVDQPTRDMESQKSESPKNSEDDGSSQKHDIDLSY